MTIRVLILIAAFVCAFEISAQVSTRSVAVTIDDLPVVSTRRDHKYRVEITRKLLAHLKKAKIPAIGFVNENKLYDGDTLRKPEVDLLRMWVNDGFELGNHTYSHRSLNRVELADYQADLLKGQTVTNQLLAAKKKEIRYFRHPFLQTGRTLEIKASFDNFLAANGYTIAPISFDNADYIFSRAYDNAFDKKDPELMRKVGEAYVPYMEAKLDYWERQSMKLFEREINQTLLIHANFINSDFMDDLALMFRKRGYRFVVLEEALKDEAYRLPDTYTGPAVRSLDRDTAPE